MSSETEKIEHYIKNIKKTEIKTFAQIKELCKEAVDDIFSDFINYPRNAEKDRKSVV